MLLLNFTFLFRDTDTRLFLLRLDLIYFEQINKINNQKKVLRKKIIFFLIFFLLQVISKKESVTEKVPDEKIFSKKK
jgi:hypothetical protein